MRYGSEATLVLPFEKVLLYEGLTTPQTYRTMKSSTAYKTRESNLSSGEQRDRHSAMFLRTFILEMQMRFSFPASLSTVLIHEDRLLTPQKAL